MSIVFIIITNPTRLYNKKEFFPNELEKTLLLAGARLELATFGL